MLSRLVSRQFLNPSSSSMVVMMAPAGTASGQVMSLQSSSSTPFVIATQPLSTSALQMLPFKEGPERDLVNFPRPKRAMYPGKVRMGFVPDEWFTYFYNKTGVTGPYMFGTGLVTYLLSKEIWVLEHEFWGGVSLFIMIVFGVKKFGPQLSAYLDKEQQAISDEFNSGKINEIKGLKEAIQEEKTSQVEAEGSKMLYEVKRENIGLQLEAAYRERLVTVWSEVKKRLDYQVDKQNVERSIQQRHMVQWIIDQVRKSVEKESDADVLKKCIGDLKGLAAVAK